MHQTVIGQETIKQMELAGEEPDVVIGCVGGGSNFAGISFPFVRKKIAEGKKYRIVAVEPSSCASMTEGELRYDFGDTAQTTPLLWMHTLGHDFIPPEIHAGGLRYHGMAPTVSRAHDLGLIEALAAREEGRKRVIVFNLSGHGMLDLPSYDAYLSGQLRDE